MAKRKTSKKKTKSKKKSSGSSSDTHIALFGREFDRILISRVVTGFAWIVGIVLIVVCWTQLVPPLHAYAASELSTEETIVILPDFPGWLEPLENASDAQSAELESIKRDIATKITDTVRFNVGTDPFDRDDLVAVGMALADSGWFADVHSIHRTQPNTIVVDAEFAQPFTMIRDDDGSHLVTIDGELLPLQYSPQARLQRQPTITGAYFDRPRTPGERWEGKDVAAGLRLVELLEGHAWTHQIIDVDVSEYNRSESIWLTTDKGARILWGRAPGDERGREVSPARKLSYLDTLYNDSGRVDRNLSELDLVLDHVYAR